MNYSDRIWQLMARVLNLEATASEREELTAILQEDPMLQQQFDLLTRVWQERKSLLDDEVHAQTSVQKIISRSAQEAPPAQEAEDVISMIDDAARRRRRRNWVAAASVIAVLSLGIWWTQRSTYGASAGNESPAKEALVAQKGSRTRSMLPDGTTVWLNAGSSLHYINNFEGATREVRLEGEGYFDVVKKEGKPFIVHTDGIDIRVLGTTFNVKSYPEDKTVETTLYHGRVQVYRSEEPNNKPIDLRPNQKLILPKEAAASPGRLSEDIKPASGVNFTDFIISPIDSTKKENERFETAWLFSRLEFRGDSFEELAPKLERWYDVKIEFTDENVKRLNFNGSFEKESVTEAFAALRLAVPYFNYKINNNVISIGSPK